ncbi:MAG: DUF3500 domain-containing protein [Planctomycetes bacterium]|nr:DUF3500 domain-containing protein [Planctomycetota bacterium]
MNLRFWIMACGTALLVASGAFWAFAQRGTPQPNTELLSAPYRGVIAGGQIEKGLFKIESTGVSTEPIVSAAEAFLGGLTDDQRQRTTFPVDDLEWRKWDNRHSPPRQGVSFKEMTEDQRKKAFELLQASLSAKGLQLSQDIMKLNGTLAELSNNYDEYGEWLYWITVMGKPSKTEPWGWQMDGHHLVINYFVLGDQVVMSPVFMGSEPIRATSGKFAGTEVLQEEQNKGLALLRSLDGSQKIQAVLSVSKTGNNALSQAYQDNLDLDFAGIPASRFDEKQRNQLLGLIQLFVANNREAHAKIKMDEVARYLDRTYFAWIGGDTDSSVFYYRIHSPVILIEFDHQNRVAPFRSREPSREHIHAVVRTPNGNDYGKDLLRQHYERHKH